MSTKLHILIVSTSLHPDSKSRRLARSAEKVLLKHDVEVDFVDLQDNDLPFCDGVDSNKHPQALELRSKVEACDGALLTAPVYNYDVNAAAKNLIELTGRAWTGKVGRHGRIRRWTTFWNVPNGHVQQPHARLSMYCDSTICLRITGRFRRRKAPHRSL